MTAKPTMQQCITKTSKCNILIIDDTHVSITPKFTYLDGFNAPSITANEYKYEAATDVFTITMNDSGKFVFSHLVKYVNGCEVHLTYTYHTVDLGEHKYDLKYDISVKFYAVAGLSEYIGIVKMFNMRDSDCRTKYNMQGNYYIITLHKNNESFEFGYVDSICVNILQTDTTNGKFYNKIMTKNTYGQYYDYEDAYDKLKKNIILQLNKNVESDKLIDMRKYLMLLKTLYNTSYNELFLELPTDVLMFLELYHGLISQIIIYKLYAKYHQQIKNIVTNEKMINQIMKYTSKRINTHQTDVTIIIKHGTENSECKLSGSLLHGYQYDDNGQCIFPTIEEDAAESNLHLRGVAKKILYNIIFDTGNSSSTLIGKGFLNYICHLMGTNSLNLHYHALMFPIISNGIGGTMSTSNYIELQIKFNSEISHGNKTAYNLYPTLITNKDASLYNTILLGHGDLVNIFKDNYCVYYDIDRTKHDLLLARKVMIYDEIITSHELVISELHTIMQYGLPRNSREELFMQMEIRKTVRLYNDIKTSSKNFYHQIDKIEILKNILQKLKGVIQTHREAFRALEPYYITVPELSTLFAQINNMLED